MTLIEILVVIIILGLILTVVGPNVFNIFFKAKNKLAEDEVRMLRQSVLTYKTMEGKLPQDLLELSNAGLLNNVDKGEVPYDPWDNPYEYSVDNSDEVDGFIILSRGEDPDTDEDDISSIEVRSRGKKNQ
jgi:general secretion pathway protein G